MKHTERTVWLLGMLATLLLGIGLGGAIDEITRPENKPTAIRTTFTERAPIASSVLEWNPEFKALSKCLLMVHLVSGDDLMLPLADSVCIGFHKGYTPVPGASQESWPSGEVDIPDYQHHKPPTPEEPHIYLYVDPSGSPNETFVPPPQHKPQVDLGL